MIIYQNVIKISFAFFLSYCFNVTTRGLKNIYMNHIIVQMDSANLNECVARIKYLKNNLKYQ